MRNLTAIAVGISLLAPGARAQTPTHVVSGTAFDSVAGAPLSGAVVQAILVDTATTAVSKDAAPRSYSTIADASGRFRLAGLPSGRFAIGFQHPALVAFGLDAPISGLELAADTSVTFNLAITAESVLGAQLCKGPKGEPQAIAAGFVVDPRRETPLAGAEITANSVELGLDRGKLRSEPHKLTVTAADDGSYKLCGVPPSAAVGLKVSRAGYRSIESELAIPDAGVARRDFSLVDTATAHGTATLVGKLVRDDGSAVGAGQVSIVALGLEVPVTDGAFKIADLPAGSWSVGAKAIGYDEQTKLVDVAEHANVSIVVNMGKKAQTLEAVNVIGKAGRDIRTLSDIEQRERLGGSTVLRPGNEFMDHAQVVADVLRGARGFIQKSDWKVVGRPYAAGASLQECGTIPKDSVVQIGRSGSRAKVMAVYLDGSRYYGGLQMLNDDVMVKQILAVEAYPDIVSVPMQWRTNDACGVIAVWTKH